MIVCQQPNMRLKLPAPVPNGIRRTFYTRCGTISFVNTHVRRRSLSAMRDPLGGSETRPSIKERTL